MSKMRVSVRPAPRKNIAQVQKQLNQLQQAFRVHMAEKNYLAALKDAKAAHRLIPTEIQPLSDGATAAIYANLFDDAIELAQKVIAKNPNHINALDALSHAYGHLLQWEKCAIYGKKALTLRDAKITDKPDLPTLSENASGKKIIAFSLFGNSAFYLESAKINAEIVHDVYGKDWICRFYIDDSVPEHFIQYVKNLHAEVVLVNEQQKNYPGTMWRFLAIDDPDVAYVCFRDADSVISYREAKAVHEWIASSAYFHTLRDAGSHTELILAGLWGTRGQAIPNMEEKIQSYCQNTALHQRFADQYFLRDCVWAYVRQNLYASDRIFDFGATHPFDDEYFDYKTNHIGCAETQAQFHIPVSLPEDTVVFWTLHTRISPLLRPNGDWHILDEERIVCTYPTTVKEGRIHGNIPRRYARGVNEGYARITFQE